MADTNASVFNTLNVINVGEHTEKKNGLTYLSWAWAWAELKKKFPESFFTIYQDPNGRPYHTDGRTCWVKTGVTAVWYDENGRKELEHIEYLPIMDFKNKSIPLDAITSMDWNKAVQRSLTKAAARHGVGLYIYSGEDLPEETEDQKEAKRRAAEEAAAKMEALNELYRKLDAAARKVTKDLSQEDKMKFFETHVVDFVGMLNYKNCADMEKLNALLEFLNEQIKKKKAA